MLVSLLFFKSTTITKNRQYKYARSPRSYSGELVIMVRSQIATMLPIRDILLPTPTGSGSEVSVHPGPVLFSGIVEKTPIGLEQLYAADVSRYHVFKR
ncbi:unnamed protein product [Mesocestoides corti]|uniref:Uncharacterized protein n=2 Tax=Mesocestoides corti TaxID=53468 RepID=A0A0R3U6D7_MESCO|nr:unnamed protein product [Mesocestoides corti]